LRHSKDYYKYFYRKSKDKYEPFMFELALKRGKDRGWYPENWTISDYEQHLFGQFQMKNKL